MHVFEGLKLGKYKTICADPPWAYVTRSKKGQTRSASVHYNVMTLESIMALPVADLAADDCVLLLWSLNPMLPHALRVIDAWGFTFKTVGFTWAKTTKRTQESWAPKWHFGMGHWTRQNTESILLATRGNPKRISKGVRQLFFAPVREHSRKPDTLFDEIERLLPGPYVELFARSHRLGWDSFGNEVGKFDEVA